jgi:hypothetical protein
MTETIPIDEILHETPEAYLCRIDQETYWLPKTKTEVSPDRKTVEIPLWLAEAKGLI